MTMTNKNCFSRLVVGCTAVFFLAACGGGGGGGGTNEPATFTKEATLILSQEVPPPTAPALANAIGGTMTVTLTTATNEISGTLTLTGDFARVTAAHIHDGDIGAAPASNVVIPLQGTGNTLSIPAGTVLTAAQAARFKAGGYYVNAHTALNGPGEIRGQLIAFADNIQPIFTANCAVSGCHVGGTSAPMSLASGVSWANLVNKAATASVAGGTRVIPNDSAASVLVKRITGTTAGPQMPSGRPLLPENERNLIKVWIDMGAIDN
jgi:hypothetical protein